MFGLDTWFSTIFEWIICWFLMSQPIKSIINISVFIRFHFSDCFLIFVISGTCLDLILVTFGRPERQVWSLLGVLEILWNFIDFQDHPKLRAQTFWKVNCWSRGYSRLPLTPDCWPANLQIPLTADCRPANHSNQPVGNWILKILKGKVIANCLPSLVAPGKQGPADMQCDACVTKCA